MDLWAPILNLDFDFKSLALSRQEAFILHQIDGTTTVRNLIHISGLSREQVREVLLKLHLAGALAAEGLPDDIIREARLVTEGLLEADGPFVVEGLETSPEGDADDRDGFSERLITDEQLASEELALLREDDAIERGEARLPARARPPAARAPAEQEPDFLELSGEEPGAADRPRPPDPAVEAGPARASSPAELCPEDPPAVRQERMARLRALFRQKLAGLPAGRRLGLAREAEGDTLAALCFDPSPEITHALLGNPHASVVQARLLASQARNTMILDHLADHPVFGRDPHLRRYLLGNIRASDALYLRLFGELAMGEIVELSLGEGLSERARRAGLEALRKLYHQASPEQRLALVLETDGSCLHEPFSLHLDPQTAALLVERNVSSRGLADSLARCRSTPLNLIRHLLHSPLAQASPPLRRLLQLHPNARR